MFHFVFHFVVYCAAAVFALMAVASLWLLRQFVLDMAVCAVLIPLPLFGIGFAFWAAATGHTDAAVIVPAGCLAAMGIMLAVYLRFSDSNPDPQQSASPHS